MKIKLASLALAMALFTGMSGLASIACPCTGDNSPCKCGSSCPCQNK
ncbi:MAG: hypothetical protein ACK481_01370 [Candidatus Melainabacteria bacterium]